MGIINGCRRQKHSDVEQVLRKGEVDQMREQCVRPEERDLSPASFGCQQHGPGDCSKIKLLSPPQPPSLFCNNFQSIEVERCVIQPGADMVECEVLEAEAAG